MNDWPPKGPDQPEGHPEGSWRSPGFRSARRRARWAQVVLTLVVLACAWNLIVLIDNYLIVQRLLASQAVSQQEIDLALRAITGTVGVLTLTVIAGWIGFVAWLSRTVDNVPPLGGGVPHESPRWSFVWWLIPIAFLWKPYTIVREAWDRLATPRHRRSGGWVVAWWLVGLAGVLSNRISAAVSDTAELVPWRDALVWNIGGMALLTTGVVLAIGIVREVQGRANERAEFAGLEATEARWPAFMVASGSPLVPGVAGTLPWVRTSALLPDPTDGFGSASAVVLEDAPALTGTLAFCPRCGTNAVPEARFCGRCGVDLRVPSARPRQWPASASQRDPREESWICPACGITNFSRLAMQCHKCGTAQPAAPPSELRPPAQEDKPSL